MSLPAEAVHLPAVAEDLLPLGCGEAAEDAGDALDTLDGERVGETPLADRTRRADAERRRRVRSEEQPVGQTAACGTQPPRRVNLHDAELTRL